MAKRTFYVPSVSIKDMTLFGFIKEQMHEVSSKAPFMLNSYYSINKYIVFTTLVEAKNMAENAMAWH